MKQNIKNGATVKKKQNTKNKKQLSFAISLCLLWDSSLCHEGTVIHNRGHSLITKDTQAPS